MTCVRLSVAILVVLGTSVPVVCRSADVYPKEMPRTGEIPLGKVIYVDDGKCPKGEIKEVTGGNREKSVPRQVRCVKRPDGSPSR